MNNYRGYNRNPMLSPFIINASDPSLVSRDRDLVNASCSSPSNSENLLNVKPPIIWNSSFPQFNSNEVYNLLSASYQPWYLNPAFGACLRSSTNDSSNISQSAAALALASFPHLWTSNSSPLVSELNRQSITSSLNVSNGIGPIRGMNFLESALQTIRYSPYFYSSPKKNLITNMSSNTSYLNQNSKTNCE